MKRISIKPVPNTTLAENKDEAANLRDETILPALAQGEAITLDFSGVETATQSYVHALIADAIRRYGDDSFDLLVFEGCTDGVQSIVRTVFEYTLLAQANSQRTSPESDST